MLLRPLKGFERLVLAAGDNHLSLLGLYQDDSLKEVEGLCSRVGIIQDGRKIAEGTLEELRGEDEDLEAAFIRLTSDALGGQIR